MRARSWAADRWSAVRPVRLLRVARARAWRAGVRRCRRRARRTRYGAAPVRQTRRSRPSPRRRDPARGDMRRRGAGGRRGDRGAADRTSRPDRSKPRSIRSNGSPDERQLRLRCVLLPQRARGAGRGDQPHAGWPAPGRTCPPRVDTSGAFIEMTLGGRTRRGQKVALDLMVPGNMVRMIVPAHGDNEFGFHARGKPAMLEPGMAAPGERGEPAAAPVARNAPGDAAKSQPPAAAFNGEFQPFPVPPVEAFQRREPALVVHLVVAGDPVAEVRWLRPSRAPIRVVSRMASVPSPRADSRPDRRKV